MSPQTQAVLLKTQEIVWRGVPVMRLLGRLTAETRDQLAPAVGALVGRGLEEVLLDLSGVDFIDSSGIGELVKLHESIRGRNHRLVLQWTPPKILELLRISGLDNFLDIRPDRRRLPRGEVKLTAEKMLGRLRPCWEMFKCNETGCEYYGGQHFVCWTLKNAPCKAVKSANLMEEMSSCARCIVFQNNVQGLGEIQSNYKKYIKQAEDSFEQVRDQNRILEDAVKSRTEQLAQSEARYRELFENANDTLMELEGSKGIFKSLNQEFERLTGATREAWLERSFFELANADQREEVERRYWIALQGQATAFEFQLPGPDGGTRTVWCSLRPSRNEGSSSRIRGSLGDISELARVRQEHQRLFQAIQGISDYVVILDERSRVVFANKAFCKAWGYAKEEEVVGRNAIEVETGMPPGHWDRVQQEVSKNGTWRGELQARRRDGDQFPIEVYATPIYDDKGRPRLVAGVSRDISARKQMEQALRESRQKYARLIEGAADAILVVDGDRRILQANKQGCDFFGLSFGDLSRMRLDDLWPPNAPRSLDEDMRRLKETGRFFDQLSFVHKSGGVIEAEINATDLGDGTYVAILRDISDRRRIEKENRNVRESFEAIFRSIVDGILLVDENGWVSVHNKQVRELLGMQPQDIDGVEADALFEAIAEKVDDPRAFRNWIASTGAEPSAAGRLEARLLGEERRILLFYTGPVRSVRSSVVGRVWVLRDITDQRRLEEQLLQSQKMESIGALAGGVAHDFNNLLTVILGHSSSLLRAIPPSHPHYKAIRNVDASAQRAAELTQGLLAFSRRAETRMRTLYVNDVVRDTLQLLGRAIPKQVELVAQLAPNLPPVRADAIQLEQVIMNLCVNARDAMQEGGTLKVQTQMADLKGKELPEGISSPGDRFVLLSVSDSGVGMAPELQKRIFEPFFTTKETGEGTGLGLALVYGIVRSHAAHIEVSSIVGEGSRFDIYFPATLAGEGRQPTPVEVGIAPGRGELVLLVDDEPVVREAAESVLQQLGYRVISAPGGHEGLEVYRERAADIAVVLLDLMMPRMRGEKVFAKFRELNPDVRIVISTGNPDLIERIPELRDRATSFANKPYRINDLARAMDSALRER